MTTLFSVGRGMGMDRVLSSSRGASEFSDPGSWGLGGYNGIWEEGGGYTVGEFLLFVFVAIGFL